MSGKSEADIGLILKALEFAAKKHRDQRRKDKQASPYINHPIALANTLCNEAGIADIETICGALLHDTVEDTETTEQELRDTFGHAISDIVMEVTDDKSRPKTERKQLQIEHAAHVSDKAKLVKLADKISNLRDMVDCPPAHWSRERKQEYFDWAKQVIDRLRGINPQLEAIFDVAYDERPE